MSTDPHPPHDEDRVAVSHAIKLRWIFTSPYVYRSAFLGAILGASFVPLVELPGVVFENPPLVALPWLVPVALLCGPILGLTIGLLLWRAMVLVPLRELSQLIQDEPSEPDHYVERGELYLFETREHHKAIEDFSRAIELEPDDWDAYYLRAVAHYAVDDLEQAILDCSMTIEGLALSADPDGWPLFDFRSVVYYEQGDYPNAVADTTRALELAEEAEDFDLESHAELYYRQAMAYHHWGDITAARKSFGKAHRLDRWWRYEPRRSRLLIRLVVQVLCCFAVALLFWELLLLLYPA